MMTQEDVAIHDAQNWKAYAQERKTNSAFYARVEYSKTYTQVRLSSFLRPLVQIQHAPTLEQMQALTER